MGTDLVESSDSTQLNAAIKSSWTLRGQWAVARELRLVLDLPEDSRLDFSTNPAGSKLCRSLGLTTTQADDFCHTLANESLAAAETEFDKRRLQQREVEVLRQTVRHVSEMDKEGVLCEPRRLIKYVLRCIRGSRPRKDRSFADRNEATLSWWKRVAGDAQLHYSEKGKVHSATCIASHVAHIP